MTTVPIDRVRGDAPEGAADGTADRPASLIGGHRVDIEGLRAIAVAVVLLYHAGVTGFDGGYVGVDVFFALSGYLMTGLLVTEHRRNGRISLRAFYARRARRLLPASVLVLLVTTVASWFVLAPLAFERAAKDAMSAGAYIVNLRFATQATDYLGADVDLSPVLHYWSLAVEEQFYAVWPLLLWFALGRSRSAGRSRALRPVIVLAVMSIVSFVIAYRITATVQPWAFFGLHARAWEFGLGGLAAFATPHVTRAGRGVRIAIGWLGLAAIVWAVVTYDSTTRFPGPGATIPVVGTVLVLLGGTVGGGAVTVLAPRPMQWIGGRSYAMYLWHWPPLVLVPIALDRTLSAWENVGLVVLACGAAVLSHRLVEDPIRFSRALAASPWRNAVLAGCLTCAAVGVPWTLSRSVDLGGSSEVAQEVSVDAIDEHLDSTVDTPVPVPADMVPSLADVADDKSPAYAAGCHLDQPTVEPVLPCEFGDVNASRTMVLFGDSHMAQWLPAFQQLGVDRGWKIVSLTKSACPSATLSVYNTNFQRDYTECDEWRDLVFDAIDELQPDAVVLANYPRRSAKQEGEDGGAEFEAAWDTALRTSIERLRTTGAEVIVMGPTPIPPGQIPDCVSGHTSDTRACDLDVSKALSPARIAAEQALSAAAGATYVDVTDWFCNDATCPVVIGRYLVYRDGSHVSTPYIAFLAPQLEARLAGIVG